MIVSRIDGGLGNQMFQYAYGKYLARKHNTKLVLDLSSYVSQPQHGYLLDQFNVHATVASSAHAKKFPTRYRRQALRPGVWGRLRDQLDPSTLKRHKESPFGFSPRHLQVSDQRYLVGYWQSERFFPGLRSELLADFTLRSPLTPMSQRVADRMRSCHSLAVHFRRGDYLTNQTASSIYAHLPIDYYRSCLTRHIESYGNVEVFVFSNDMAWCQEHVQLPVPTHWIDHNDRNTAYEDMVLMSHARSCIIANSTFSWWGAWLNTATEKQVYAPANWFRPGKLDDSQIVPNSWQLHELDPRPGHAAA